MTATAIIWKGPVEAGEVQKDNFIQQEQPIPTMTDGTALVEIQTLSVDPYMRVRSAAMGLIMNGHRTCLCLPVLLHFKPHQWCPVPLKAHLHCPGGLGSTACL